MSPLSKTVSCPSEIVAVAASLSQVVTPSQAIFVEAKVPKVNVSPFADPLPERLLHPSLPLKVPSFLIVRFGWPTPVEPHVPVKAEAEEEHPDRAITAATAVRVRAARAVRKGRGECRLFMPLTVVAACARARSRFC